MSVTCPDCCGWGCACYDMPSGKTCPDLICERCDGTGKVTGGVGAVK